MHRDYPQIIKGWFYTENTRVKKVIHNQAISCVFRLLTIGISVFFYPQTQEEIYWFLRVFHLCISGVENFF